MKAADIPDEDFLAAVAAIQEDRAGWALVWDVAEFFGYPDKIIRAKARKLIQRGEMDGCWCGCRGDFEVIPLEELPMPTGGLMNIIWTFEKNGYSFRYE